MIFDRELYPLTHAQMSIWNIVKFYPNTSYVNVAAIVRIKENVDYPLLNKAINIALKDNEALRIRIVENGKEPEQYFSEYREQEFSFIDFSYPNGPEDLNQWKKLRCQEMIKIFDSDLYDFVMIKISKNEGAFFLKIHHIATDAWSISLLVRQILQNYKKLRDSEEIISDKRPSFKEYIDIEKESYNLEKFHKDKVFWDDVFSTVPDFTTFNPEKVLKNTQAERKTYVIPRNLTFLIKDFSHDQDVSPFCILFSVLTLYIRELTSKTDIVIGTPVLNRSGVKEKGMMGMFIHTIPFRIKLNLEDNFYSFVKSVSIQWRSLLRHQKYPYYLIRKSFREIHGVGDKLYDVVLSFQNAKFEVNDLDYNVEWLFNGSETNSLSIHVNDREDTGNYIIDYDYLTHVFSEEDITRLHESLLTLLNKSLTNPYLKLTDINTLSFEQEHDVLWNFNNTHNTYPQEETIVSLFEKQARLTPEKVALIFENQAVTYQELNKRSNQLARFLVSKGVKKDAVVGLLVDRSIELIVAILAVLKAGGAYLPIDPTYPVERIDYMLKDSDCQLLLIYNVERTIHLVFEGSQYDLKQKDLFYGDTTDLEYKPSPSDLAYVIYTSGSTGNPKGVMVEHKGLNNFVHALKKYVTNATSALSIATVSFDLFFIETLFPLLTGIRVILANREEAMVPYLLLELIEGHKVNFVLATPSRMKLILKDSKAYVLRDVTEIFIGGESFPEQLLLELKHVTNARILNAYGPTETSICATIKNLSEHDPITIGKPIANTQIYILDQELRPVPVGQIGEIFISGDGLGRGYINNEGLTRERFIANPFIPGSKMYKTGDLGRWRSNGEIEYIGRNDHQVKIRGLRIELGEIEKCLEKHDLIKEAVVLCNEDNSHKKYLCAYLTTRGKVLKSELRSYLSRLLPDYMIPAYFIEIESLPLTPNGKVDRKALPKPDILSGQEELYTAPRNPLEQKLVELWKEVLNITNVGIDHNFFDLGGDSLSILEILSGLYPNDWGLSAQDFYNYPTIRKLSEKILGNRSHKPLSPKRLGQTNEEFKSIPTRKLLNINTGDILLTGATGFLGIHILYELLCTTSDKIYCLIRGNNPEKKLYQLLQYYFPQFLSSRFNGRIIVVNSDLSQENFGLSMSDRRDLAQAVTRVIHTGALVNHYGEYDQFYNVNVKGTQEVIKFCMEYGKKLNHISTISVSGNFILNDDLSGKFTEQDFYIGQDYKANVYVRSKFEAENLLLQAMENGLNATIFRVGALTGRYSDGQFQINIDQNALYRLLKSILLLEAVPLDFLHHHLEFTPVDYCAKAIIHLTQSKENSLPVYHVFNHKTINAAVLLRFFETAGISIKTLSVETFNRLIASVATTNSGKEIVSGIISNLSVNGTLGFVPKIQVDSSRTLEHLRNVDFEWPDIDYEYILKVLNHMQGTGFLRKSSGANQ